MTSLSFIQIDRQTSTQMTSPDCKLIRQVHRWHRQTGN